MWKWYLDFVLRVPNESLFCPVEPIHDSALSRELSQPSLQYYILRRHILLKPCSILIIQVCSFPQISLAVSIPKKQSFTIVWLTWSSRGKQHTVQNWALRHWNLLNQNILHLYSYSTSSLQVPLLNHSLHLYCYLTSSSSSSGLCKSLC